MNTFEMLFIIGFQLLGIAYGARIPEVKASIIENEGIKNRNPRVLFGVST